MESITLTITDCRQCPAFERRRRWTEDSWDEVYYWLCTECPLAEKDRVQGEPEYRAIDSYMEWNDPIPSIPDWCPRATDKPEPTFLGANI